MKRSRRSAALVALTAAAVVASSPGAWAADVDGTLVNAVEVNQWTPPSSDPAGIAVDSDGNLTISDSEVNETTFYDGANVFHATRSGALLSTSDTTHFSEEPTGIAYGPNNLVFVSDDDADAVFVANGFDDTSPVRISTSGFMTDPEGVAYDTYRGELLIANGEGTGFVRYNPGADQQFGTADDAPGQLITVPGATDNEGIAYDGVRDTVLLLDAGSNEKIFELNPDGSAILNTIDISGISGIAMPAGIEVAEATAGGGRNYFVVDRVRDPGTSSSYNDGRMFEIRAEGLSDAGPGVNQPPTANAGVDQVVEVTKQITLAGSGNDPEGGPLTYAWSMTSGPGTVTFGSADAATTTASFATAGQYVLRLTVTDDQGASGYDEVGVTVTDEGGDASIVVPLTVSSDDAREGDVGTPTYVSTTAQTNDLGTGVNASGTYMGQPYPTKIGLRFPNLQIPQGAEIISAKVQFMADSEASTGAADLTIVGEQVDNAITYSNTAPGKVSTRTYGTTSVSWTPPEWLVANEQRPAQLTPELNVILQEIVDRPGWAAGNAAGFMIEGTGRRIARSVDAVTTTGARQNAAPRLLLEFTTSPSGTRNQAPTVDAGADSTVKMPAAATLDGTVTDDGLPAGGTLTTGWSKVSGPGAVTFGDSAAVDTTATFDVAGTYVLRLTANDGGAPAVSDDVTITVLAADATNQAPTVDAGADATVTTSALPATADLKGTVTDADGLPTNGKLTSEWSKVSGPGVVSFADRTAVATKATFEKAGTYVLRLTGDDGALQASDDVTVVVKLASTGGGDGGSTPPPTTTPPPTSPPTAPTPPAEVEAEVTLQAEHRAIAHGGTVRLDGMVTKDGKGAAGAAVELYVSRDGGDFELLDSGKAASDGSFSFEDRPDVHSAYVARSGGSSSDTVEVAVRPRLVAKLRHSMVKAGTQTAIVGFVSPAADGHVLRLQKRFGSKWRTVRTISVAGGELTRFRFMVRPKLSLAHWYRVVSPAQAGRALAVVGGKQLRLQAYNATVKRVNHRADLVVVRNTGRVAFSFEGWMLLERRSGQKVGLPDFTVRPGRVVRIHSGEGADNRRNLHLGTGEMWAPRGVAVLRDARLRLADRLRF